MRIHLDEAVPMRVDAVPIDPADELELEDAGAFVVYRASWGWAARNLWNRQRGAPHPLHLEHRCPPPARQMPLWEAAA